MSWAERAKSRLNEAGFKSGAARRQVIELLEGEHCAVTALEIDRRLPSVGRATVYRTLEQLEELELVYRVDVGGETAAYERNDPGKHHHHRSACAAAAWSPSRTPRWSGRSTASGREQSSR